MKAGVNPRRQQLQLVHDVPGEMLVMVMMMMMVVMMTMAMVVMMMKIIDNDDDVGDDFDDGDDDDEDHQVTTARTDKISDKMRRPSRVWCKCFIQSTSLIINIISIIINLSLHQHHQHHHPDVHLLPGEPLVERKGGGLWVGLLLRLSNVFLVKYKLLFYMILFHVFQGVNVKSL